MLAASALEQLVDYGVIVRIQRRVRMRELLEDGRRLAKATYTMVTAAAVALAALALSALSALAAGTKLTEVSNVMITTISALAKELTQEDTCEF